MPGPAATPPADGEKGRERWRQQALDQLEVLDTPPEESFDGLVRAAAALCGTPVALISLVDRDRQWFKASVGLGELRETPREISFCTHTIEQPSLLEVEDARHDPQFATNPLVQGEPQVRFYAGAPLRLSGGAAVGTLCVIDYRPQRLSPEQRQLLQELATTAVRLLEGRRALHTERRLRQEAERLSAGMPIGLFAADATGALCFTNPRWQEIFGLDAPASLGHGWLAAVHPEDRPKLEEQWQRLLSDRASLQLDFRLRRGDGQIRHLRSQVRAEADDPTRSGRVFLGFVEDRSEEVNLQAEIRHQANHDALTGLLNRRAFDHQLRRCLEPSAFLAEPACHALLYLDLDLFKIVNDVAGHAGGDAVLVKVAQMLQSLQGPHGRLARLGGDEFALLLLHCTVAEAEAVAARIVERLEATRFAVAEERFRIGVSIGVAPIDQPGLDPASVLRAADQSCSSAKEAGRNRWHVWREQEGGQASGRRALRWVTRLQQALDENRLVLHAQRILPLGDLALRPLQVELLLRIQEADGAVVSPRAFFPAAERFQIASRLDHWVLRQTLALLLEQPSLQAVGRIGLNLSAQSVADPDFRRSTEELLAQAGEAICRLLCFEITETAAVHHGSAATAFIDSLRAHHCAVALDDFGSGMASFGSLKDLSLTHLKIDGQFVRGLIRDRLDALAVRCFVEVADVMGLVTVAESVESQSVLERLRQIGVDEAQGYHLHRPEPFLPLLAQAGLVATG